jgi:transposase
MKKAIKPPGRLELSETQVEELQEKLINNTLSESDRTILLKSLQSMIWLYKMLEHKKMSIKKLVRLFGFKTEKNLFNEGPANQNQEQSPGNDTDKTDKKDPPSAPPPATPASGPKGGGHGKNGKDDYPGAGRVFHKHETLQPGVKCPACLRGNLYEVKAGSFITIKGAPPLAATIHSVQKLRCSGCGIIFTAEAAKDLKKRKYDEASDVTISYLRYGVGVPLNRLSLWQKNLGVPIPASTAWERSECLGSSVYPVYGELMKEAAQGELAFMDDTTNRILDLKKQLKAENAERTGIYTTGIVSKNGDREIHLFMTGNKYAGENLDLMLNDRDKNLPPILTMSDAAAMNNTKMNPKQTSLCMTHGRRGFVDLQKTKEKNDLTYYPIHLIGKIYYFDKLARAAELSSLERLAFHQKKSGPVLKKLRRWFLKCFALNKVEPNSDMGEAIQYMLKYWRGLTEFLRTPGAPISNEIAERLLKRMIMHRKNSISFKSELGAKVGDIILSLIETCRANGKNAFEYLVTLHRNKKSVHENPGKWLPWNYEANLTSVAM